MPSRHPGPICGESKPVWCATPGSTGIHDSADADHSILIPRGRRSQGAISMAEEGELVLAQVGNKVGLPAGKGTRARKSVLLTSMEKGWYQWAKQFKAASRSRVKVDFKGKKPKRKAILDAYRTAAKQAGPNGRLIISAGHGYSRGFAKGAVDLAPGKQLFLSSRHFDIQADPNLTLPKKQQEEMDTFKAIGKIFQQHKVAEVVFLTCNVGNSHDFLQEIADEWKVKVGGYRSFVCWSTVYLRGKNRRQVMKYGIHLENQRPVTGPDKLHSSRDIPKITRNNFWWIPPRPPKKKAPPPAAKK